MTIQQFAHRLSSTAVQSCKRVHDHAAWSVSIAACLIWRKPLNLTLSVQSEFEFEMPINCLLKWWRAWSAEEEAGRETECREQGRFRQCTMPRRPGSDGRFVALCGHAT